MMRALAQAPPPGIERRESSPAIVLEQKPETVMPPPPGRRPTRSPKGTRASPVVPPTPSEGGDPSGVPLPPPTPVDGCPGSVLNGRDVLSELRPSTANITVRQKDEPLAG